MVQALIRCSDTFGLFALCDLCDLLVLLDCLNVHNEFVTSHIMLRCAMTRSIRWYIVHSTRHCMRTCHHILYYVPQYRYCIRIAVMYLTSVILLITVLPNALHHLIQCHHRTVRYCNTASDYIARYHSVPHHEVFLCKVICPLDCIVVLSSSSSSVDLQRRRRTFLPYYTKQNC